MHAKTQFLLEMLDDMWWTDNWIDPLAALLADWPAAHCDRPHAPGLFSVTEIVNHTAFWEEFARRQLTGEPLDDLGDRKAASWGNAPDWMPAWPVAGEHYAGVRQGLKRALREADPASLAEQPATDALTREARVYTRAIHAGYHAGQLSLLRRLQGVKAGKAAAPGKPVSAAEPFDGARDLLVGMADSAWRSGFSIDPFETLMAKTDAAHADWRPRAELPSTTEIVNHMAFWTHYAALRLRGESAADLPRVTHGQTPEGMPPWPEAGDHLVDRFGAFRDALLSLDAAALARPCPGQGKALEAGHTAQWLAQGVIVHHAYHVGQLVLMRQLAGLDA